MQPAGGTRSPSWRARPSGWTRTASSGTRSASACSSRRGPSITNCPEASRAARSASVRNRTTSGCFVLVISGLEDAFKPRQLLLFSEHDEHVLTLEFGFRQRRDMDLVVAFDEQ